MKRTIASAITAVCLLICINSSAQCNSTGALNANTFTNDASSGSFGFINPAFAKLSDNNRASAVAILTLLSGSTNMLNATNFSFNVPTYTSICGIKVEIQKRAQDISILAWVTDKTVTLLKNGVPVGTNKATSSSWGSGDVYETYGGTNDLWGTTWTLADINNANFGVGFAAQITGLLSLLPSAQVNQMRVTVYYEHIIVPIVLVDFRESKTADQQTQIQWTLAPNDQPVTASLLYSQDNVSWNTVYTQANHVNTTNTTYKYKIGACNGNGFYKLKLSSVASELKESNVIAINCEDQRKAVVYPNPVINHAIVTNTIYKSPVATLKSIDGKSRQVPAYDAGNNSVRLDLSAISPGIYFLQTGKETVRIFKSAR